MENQSGKTAQNYMDLYDIQGYSSSSFEQVYHCYPITGPEKSHLQSGDKVQLPLSALMDRLSVMDLPSPMVFMLRNPRTAQVIHCGVMDFTSEEGSVLLPQWMMEKMDFEPGDVAVLKMVHLPKGTYVKLQPHTSDLLQVSNPRAVLETVFRRFTCLTAGKTVMIMYLNKKFYIDVLETKPSSSAVCIVDTDCEVDFTSPLDNREPESESSKPPDKKTNSYQDDESTAKKTNADQQERKSGAFTGVAEHLDGKNHVICHPTLNQNPTSSTKNYNVGGGEGKLEFGSSGTPEISWKQKKDSAGIKTEKKTKSFQAFTGKSYRLVN